MDEMQEKEASFLCQFRTAAAQCLKCEQKYDWDRV